jgi:hypothetical protein
VKFAAPEVALTVSDPPPYVEKFTVVFENTTRPYSGSDNVSLYTSVTFAAGALPIARIDGVLPVTMSFSL